MLLLALIAFLSKIQTVPQFDQLTMTVAAGYIALTAADQVRDRTMTFIHPAENETFNPGTTYNISTLNEGLAADLHLREGRLSKLTQQTYTCSTTTPGSVTL
jgi:hypothetical protein